MRYQFDDIAVVGDISQQEAAAYAERAPKNAGSSRARTIVDNAQKLLSESE